MRIHRSRISAVSLPSALVTPAVLGMVLAASAARADTPDILNDSFLVSLGTYIVNADTTVRLDGETQGTGTRVDWDRAFGGGSFTRFRIDGQWRFAERHKLRAQWFSTSRSKSRTIDEEIDWGDETFPVDSKVKGDISYDIYQLTYEYAFWRRDTYEVSASLGAYYAQFDATLSATVDNPGGSTDRRISADGNVGLPLPVLGLRGQWVLPYDLSLDLSGQWFSLSIDEYDGNLQDYRLTLTWQPKSWLGVGVGYDWFQAHGSVDKDDFKGDLDWTFQGPMIYYSAAF